MTIRKHAVYPLLLLGLALLVPAVGTAQAEEPPPPAALSFEELQATIARMQARIDRLGSASTERDSALRFLEQQVEQAAGEIAGSGEATEALRGEAAALSTRLQDLARDRDRLSGEAGVRSTALEAAQAREGELAARLAAAEAETQRLRKALDEAHRLLAAAETRVDEQQDEIEGLDERLARALKAQVEELEQYRSEFFGRLRAALGDRPDLRIVGDRFVLQSELLFASGSAKLDPRGEAELRALARTLEEVAAQIPPEVDWILRIDGHTDRLPIRDGLFASNWELSVARAISVLEFLIRQGIPPQRLAAAGFGEYRPLDPRDDEVAYRRNRRIEFKLTEG
jgi:chemotaxis protein MotB